MKKIVLVTSIAPKNIANQQEAINSWITNGFQVISCNSSGEIHEVREFFPKVEFIEVTRDARQIIGRPCPYIYDMLQILKEKMDSVGGIINSDIYMQKISKDLYNYIYREALDKVLFMRRNDVDKLEDAETLNSTMYIGGIDFFLLNKKNIEMINDDGLIMGQIVWDYWLPIFFSINHIRIKEVVNPILFHKRHPVQWNAGDVDYICQGLCHKYFKDVEDKNAVFFIKDFFWNIMSRTDLQICFVTDEMRRKRVAVKAEDRTIEHWTLQTHKKIDFYKKGDLIEKEYDYVIEIPYFTIVTCIMVDLCLWIAECYNLRHMKLAVYWRGNISHKLKPENCNEKLLKKFNHEINPISISSVFEKNVNEKSNIYQICVSSISIEEDTEKIWESQKVKGKIYVYPAGYIAQNWVLKYGKIDKDVKLLGFVDSSMQMQKKIIVGLNVFGTDVLRNLQEYDKVIIISNMYADEIYKSLISKIPEDKIVVWNEYDAKKWIKMNGEREC